MTRFTKIATAVALASFAASAMAADPIKIGVNGPFTGGSSSMGVGHVRDHDLTCDLHIREKAFIAFEEDSFSSGGLEFHRLWALSGIKKEVTIQRNFHVC